MSIKLNSVQQSILNSYNAKARALGFSHVRYAGVMAIQCMKEIKAAFVATKGNSTIKPQMSRAEKALARAKAKSIVTKTEEVKEVIVSKPESVKTAEERSLDVVKRNRKARREAAKAAREHARKQAAEAKARKAARKKATTPVEAAMSVASDAVANYESAPTVENKAVAAKALKDAEIKVLAEEAAKSVALFETAPTRKNKARAAVAITRFEKAIAITEEAQTEEPNQLEVLMAHVNKCVEAYNNNPTEDNRVTAQNATELLQLALTK